jgi:DNA topoisomerase-1
MLAFAKALPTIRATVARDLKLTGLPREKMLATVVSLLEETAIRVGNEEYARDNDSYGLTTFEDEHAEITPTKVRFHFRGKSGKMHEVTVRDRRLARIVKASRDLPGQKLFEYLDDADDVHPIRSEDVNDYLRTVSGEEFSAKDFRTWEATMLCAQELAAVHVDGATALKAAVVEAVKLVADKLGNTPAVCKKSYIHPGIIAEFLADGGLTLKEKTAHRAGGDTLGRHEAAVVALIERIAARQGEPLTATLRRSIRSERGKRATGRSAKSSRARSSPSD